MVVVAELTRSAPARYLGVCRKHLRGRHHGRFRHLGRSRHGKLDRELLSGQPITVYAGATLQVNAADALGYYGANPSAINLNSATFTNNGGAFHDTLPAFNLTAGTITAASAGDAGGLNYIFDGTITTNSASSASVIATPGTINLRNGQLNNGVANSSVTFNVALGAGPIDLLVASTLGNESGANGLVKTGAGTMLLSNPDTYSGNTLISGGTPLLGDNLSMQNSRPGHDGNGRPGLRVRGYYAHFRRPRRPQ